VGWLMHRLRITCPDLVGNPASIVFSDEGDILQGSGNPDLLYNQIIRPWKSRLALAYIDHRTFSTDLRLIILTAVTIVSRPAGLRAIGNMLHRWQLDPLVIQMAARQEPLLAYPPPGDGVRRPETEMRI